MNKVLMIEDQKEVRTFVKEYFEKRDVEIIEAWSGNEGLTKLDAQIQVVLLDIMMPGIDGYEVCRQIRAKSNVPIVFISALSQEENQLKAYTLGADDYIIKPFKSALLYAKVMALIKRSNNQLDKVTQIGKIKIDHYQHLLINDDNQIYLTDKEYRLLDYLLKNRNRVIPRSKILDDVWGYDYFGDGRAVDTYIKRIRKHFGKYSYYIKTIRNSGYMLTVSKDSFE